MNTYRRSTSIRTLVATAALGLIAIHCGHEGSPSQPTTTPTVSGGPGLTSLVLREASVVGGNAVIGTVTLSSAAPGGAMVSLSGSDPATVPTSVTVGPNSLTATFSIATHAVQGTMASTIQGSYGGTSASAVLSVTPAVSSTAFARFGITGVDVTNTCGMIGNGASFDCAFDGSTSQAPGTITAWEWTYTVANNTLAVTTAGPILTHPGANCGLLPPPPLPAGTTSFPLTVTLRVRDSLGNVSAELVDRGARVLPQGACGF